VLAGGDGIDSTFVPWVALAQALQGKIASFYYTMCGNGILGITGTAGVKTAVVSQEGA